MMEEQTPQQTPPMLDPVPSGGGPPSLPAGAPAGQRAGPWSAPAPHAPPAPPAPPPAPPPRRTSALRIILSILLVLALLGSLGLNLVLLASLGATVGAGGMSTAVLRRGQAAQTVAVCEVAGILGERAVNGFHQFFDAVRTDGDVKAVVLRVNSPGGGVTASDQICQMVKDLKASGKKVVVSMGGLAASGGYYISAPADEIYAEPTSTTGSIGVMAGWVVLKGTMDKIGAEAVILKSTHAQGWKDAMSTFRRPDDYQVQHIQGVLDAIQNRFEDVVKAGRGNRLKTRQITLQIPATAPEGASRPHTETEPLNGKIYLAEEALKLGLIDAIGYQQAAIDRAAALAGLTQPRIVHYSRRISFMERLIEGKSEPAVKLDLDWLDQLRTPRFLMLWQGQ